MRPLSNQEWIDAENSIVSNNKFLYDSSIYKVLVVS